MDQQSPNQSQNQQPNQPSNLDQRKIEPVDTNQLNESIGFNANDVKRDEPTPVKKPNPGPPMSGGLNIGNAPMSGDENKVQLSKSTLAGMYQSVGSSSKMSRLHFDFSSILNYSVLLINLAAIGAVIFLIILPQYNLYTENQTTIVTAEQEFTKVEAHHKYLKNLEQLEDELYKNIEISEQAIPVEEEVPQFLNQISQIAKESAVTITKNDFSGASRAPKVTEDPDSVKAAQSKASSINVRTTGTGAYDDLILFLAKLENARRIAVISDMQLALDELDEPNGQSTTPTEVTDISLDKRYTLELTLTGFYMKDPQINDLTVDQLVSKQGLPEVLERLDSMRYYELTDIEQVESGRENPFTEEAAGFDSELQSDTTLLDTEDQEDIQ